MIMLTQRQTRNVEPGLEYKGFVYSVDGGTRTRTRVMLRVFLVQLQVSRLMLQVFLVMLHMFPVMLHVFPVTLQETRATLHAFAVRVRVRRIHKANTSRGRSESFVKIEAGGLY